MKLFGLTILRETSNIEHRTSNVEQQPVEPAAMAAAFAVPEDQVQWRAMLQVLDELEREAIMGAQRSLGNHGVSAGFIGGAEWLRVARDRFVALREAAIGMAEKRG